LLLSSPTKSGMERDVFSYIKKYAPPELLFMPFLDDEDLDSLYFGCLQGLSDFSLEELRNRFDIFGGNLRRLLVTQTSPEYQLEAVLKSFSHDKLKEYIMNLNLGGAIPEDVDGRIIQYEEEDFRFQGLRFCSEHIRSLANKLIVKLDRESVKAWIRAASASGDPKVANSAGMFFEPLAHQRFETKKPVQMQARDLAVGGTFTLDVDVVEVYDDSKGLFNTANASQIAKNSVEKTYYRPCVSNLPAIDSFLVVGDHLILFQFTIAKTHKVQAKFLVDFVDGVLSKHKIKTVTLAFVCDQGPRLKGVQKYKGTKDQPLKNQALTFKQPVLLRQVECILSDY